MIGWIIFLALATCTHCQTGAPSSDGALQCQCTCTPVGIPNKTIYTSGNMNVVEKQTSDNMDITKDIPNSVTESVLSKTTPPTKVLSKEVENKAAINRKITEFQDVAVSKIKHSLGSVINENVMKKLEETKEVVRPNIKWLHSASSSDVLASKAQLSQGVSPTSENTQAISPKTEITPVVTGSVMVHKDKTVAENGQVNGHVSSLSGMVQNDASKHLGEGKTTQDSVIPSSQAEVMNVPSGINNMPTNKPTVDQNIVSTAQTMNGFESTNKNSDKVAADIGFVLDGSPIISGVMSGMGRTSHGTGFIVENIKGDKQSPPDKGYFMNQNINMGPSAHQVSGEISNPSLSQAHFVSDSRTTTMETPRQKTINMRSSNNDVILNTQMNKQSPPDKGHFMNQNINMGPSAHQVSGEISNPSLSQAHFVVDSRTTTMETPRQKTINMRSSNNDVILNTQMNNYDKKETPTSTINKPMNNKPGTFNQKQMNWNNNGNHGNQKQNSWNNNGNSRNQKQNNWNNNGNAGNQKQTNRNNKGNSSNQKQKNWNYNGNAGNQKQTNWNNKGNSSGQKQTNWNNNGNSGNQKQTNWNNKGNSSNQKQTNWNNKGNSSNQKQTNWNNKGNSSNQQQTNWNKKGNSLVKKNQQFITPQNNNKWQKMNSQNNGGNLRRNNRNQWNTNQMKPFNIQRDQKQSGGWNNNGPNFGNLNWEPQSTPTSMPFGGMGMDSLMLFGQHHFQK